MGLKQDDKFPTDVTFKYIPIELNNTQDPLTCEQPILLKLDKHLEETDGNTLIVSVPGAFTPTCTANHIPPFLTNLSKLKKEKNIGSIIVISANDAFVLNTWGKLLLSTVKVTEPAPKIFFASDGNAAFSKEYDLSVDASANGMGIRTARYAIVVEDKTRKISYLGKEVERGVKFSGIDAILQAKL